MDYSVTVVRSYQYNYLIAFNELFLLFTLLTTSRLDSSCAYVFLLCCSAEFAIAFTLFFNHTNTLPPALKHQTKVDITLTGRCGTSILHYVHCVHKPSCVEISMHQLQHWIRYTPYPYPYPSGEKHHLGL